MESHDADAPPVATQWTIAATQLLRRLVPEFRSGQLRFWPGRAGHLGTNHDLSNSELHESIDRDAGLRAFMASDPEFQALRGASTLLYWTLHRFGVALGERYVLCDAVARCFEDFFEVRPGDAIRHAARLAAARRSTH